MKKKYYKRLIRCKNIGFCLFGLLLPAGIYNFINPLPDIAYSLIACVAFVALTLIGVVTYVLHDGVDL